MPEPTTTVNSEAGRPRAGAPDRCACGVERGDAWLCPACGRPPDRLRDADRWRTCVHEAGHAVIGHLVGLPPDLVSIKPGRSHRGINLLVPVDYEPTPGEPGAFFDRALPLSLRDRLEAQIAVSVAGPIAGLSAAPRSGFEAPDDAEDREAAARAAASLAALATAQRERLEEACQETEAMADEDAAHGTAVALAREPMAATFLVEFIRNVVQAMLARDFPVVLKVAKALDEAETITGEQVVAAFPEYLR